jgi:Uri superfamily endonuclease
VEAVTNSLARESGRPLSRGAVTKGTYLLLMELEDSQAIAVGALGVLSFSRGFYAYVGSAMNGLESRVARHLGHRKKRRWHVDYLLERAPVYDVRLVPGQHRLECVFATALSRTLLCVRHFGSSDCSCPGHLFFASAKSDLEAAIARVLADLDADWHRRLH